VLTDDDKQWIRGQLEKVETTLLTEFHKWASPVELRQKSHAAAFRALDAEVESVSDRMKNLEGAEVGLPAGERCTSGICLVYPVPVYCCLPTIVDKGTWG